jgi:UDP-glucose 4-epimerase
VFSSTAAVYGDPLRPPIDETHPTQPVNPYGSSKLAIERMLAECSSISVFGNDWPTRDGTCVRDYIHVSDLCVAHRLALDWLAAGGRYECFNLGNGDGATVLEVIEAARRVTGKTIKMVQAERRAGDPPSLVADASKARQVLGWKPARAHIEGIVRHAWNHEQRRAR